MLDLVTSLFWLVTTLFRVQRDIFPNGIIVSAKRSLITIENLEPKVSQGPHPLHMDPLKTRFLFPPTDPIFSNWKNRSKELKLTALKIIPANGRYQVGGFDHLQDLQSLEVFRAEFYVQGGLPLGETEVRKVIYLWPMTWRFFTIQHDPTPSNTGIFKHAFFFWGVFTSNTCFFCGMKHRDLTRGDN